MVVWVFGQGWGCELVFGDYGGYVVDIWGFGGVVVVGVCDVCLVFEEDDVGGGG